MKKTLALLLCFLMLASLASCKGGNDPTETTAATTTEDIADGGGGSGSNKSHTTILTQKERVQLAFDEVIAGEKAMIYEGSERYIWDALKNGTTSSDTIYSFVEVDMDGDRIDELIIKLSPPGYAEENLLLHYEDSVVYGFSFDYDALGNICPDGSFRWYTYNYDWGSEYGYSKLSFDKGSLRFTELCRNESYHHYYIDGKEVTLAQYESYIKQHFNNSLEFKDMDISKLGAGKAIQLAEAYWGIKQGSFDEETGYRYKLTANLYSKKIGEHGYYDYCVCLYKFIVNDSYYKHSDCLRINIETGEIIPYDYDDGCWHYGKGKG